MVLSVPTVSQHTTTSKNLCIQSTHANDEFRSIISDEAALDGTCEKDCLADSPWNSLERHCCCCEDSCLAREKKEPFAPLSSYQSPESSGLQSWPRKITLIYAARLTHGATTLFPGLHEKPYPNQQSRKFPEPKPGRETVAVAAPQRLGQNRSEIPISGWYMVTMEVCCNRFRCFIHVRFIGARAIR
jgi:hypothetical protein